MLIWKSVAGHELRPDGHGEVGEVVSHVTRAPFDAVSLKSESETAVRRSAHEGPRQTPLSPLPAARVSPTLAGLGCYICNTNAMPSSRRGRDLLPGSP
jgi:hypothetical protein